MYRIVITPIVRRYMKKLKDNGLIQEFGNIIKRIENHPFEGERKSGDLNGVYCMSFMYVRTEYEVAYVIAQEPNPKIIILLANKRENFYEQLRRYLNNKY